MVNRLAATLMAATSSLIFHTACVAQTKDFSQVEIETIPVRDGVYMLTGDGGNIGVFVGEDGVILIDDQFAPLTEKIQAAIANLSSEPIKFLINTHWHFDHTGGNENLGKEGVIILAHDNVRKRMQTGGLIEAFQREIPPAPAAALPVITFADGVTFHVNGDTLQAIHPHVSGHTDGDTVLYWQEANVIHTGDLFFNGFYPFIDTSSGGSIAGMIAGVDKVLALTDENTRIIPGHGPLADRQALQDYRNMLVTVQATAQKAIANGLSLTEFIQSNPTEVLDKKWGTGFLKPSQFQTIVYQSVQQLQ